MEESHRPAEIRILRKQHTEISNTNSQKKGEYKTQQRHPHRLAWDAEVLHQGTFTRRALLVSSQKLGFGDGMGNRLRRVVKRELVSETPRENTKRQPQKQES